MDLNKQFKDLDDTIDKLEKESPSVNVPPPENIPTEEVLPNNLVTPVIGENSIEKLDDFKESNQILAELEKGIALAQTDEPGAEALSEPVNSTNSVNLYILPIALTLLALLLAGTLLYFFAMSKPTDTVKAITNEGQVLVPTSTSEIVFKEEPTIVVATPTEATSTPVFFENGTTTIVNVRFSYDKVNYDNTPRGIFLNEKQIWDGDYKDFKISPSNRGYANDHFFGIDRYTVSLIGSCIYTVDTATILVSNMVEGDKVFTGKVEKVIDSSTPRVVCEK